MKFYYYEIDQNLQRTFGQTQRLRGKMMTFFYVLRILYWSCCLMLPSKNEAGNEQHSNHFIGGSASLKGVPPTFAVPFSISIVVMQMSSTTAVPVGSYNSCGVVSENRRKGTVSLLERGPSLFCVFISCHTSEGKIRREVREQWLAPKRQSRE